MNIETTNRRDMLRTGTALSAAVMTGATSRFVHASEESTGGEQRIINIGVIGTGGRGTGAINDTLTINENVRLVAMADLKRQNCERALRSMSKRHAEKVDVKEENIYDGLDAYQKVLENPEVDLVLIASPPGFHPSHIKDAVDAGKHVFAEKPSCVDPAGYHICLDAHDQAVKNGTAIVTGTQYRRQANYVGAVKQIRDGAIGDVISATSRYCSNGIWYKNRKEGASNLDYQLDNWMHFIWLSGDQICEQAVHNIDTLNWVMGSAPESAYGSGGRFTRPDDSEMWDSMSIDYVYPGNRVLSFKCRQIQGTQSDNSNIIYGSEGTMSIGAGSSGSRIVDRKGKEVWSMKGSISDAYQQEHKDLVDSIRADKPIVELKSTAGSSLTAVMGRMAAYTGKRVDWDFVAQKSNLDLFPKGLNKDTVVESNGYAIPGKTKLT